MSISSNSDPCLEQCLYCDGTYPRELTTTPVECPLTATQEHHQRTPQLELENITENTPIEGNNPTFIEALDPVTNSVPNIPLNFGNLDIHTLLTVLTQQAIPCHKLHSVISPPILRRFPRSQSQPKALKKTFRSMPVTSQGDQ